MTFKTVNRGWLKRQIEKGNVMIKCRYHLTDDYAWDAANNGGRTEWMPARISHPRYIDYINEYGYERQRCADDDRKPGFINLDETDFLSSCGRAYKDLDDPENVITFAVHSNLVYSCKLVDGGK